MSQQFNRDDVLDWKVNIVTKHFLQTLLVDKDNLVAQWTAGDFTAETADGTSQLNAKALGQLHALEQIIQTIKEYEDTFDFKETDYA